ncbi:hypothetical protein FACS189452_03020 [Bacteroidia bacterium]|nr:hypothetical protein FACS189452_03020 [Bacteroidia bacterium]GHT82178.1 hypothetical protein FACS189467_7210 [Bacteroidia bacterium]
MANVMKKIIFLLCAVCAGFAVSAQNKNWLDLPYVEVTGKAEMEIVPNEIYVSITISEQDNKAKKSVEQLEREMKTALQAVGVNVEKDLRIKDMDSDFKKYWYKSNQIYTSKNYQLLVHNATELGKSFQAIEALGISHINIERVSHSDIQKYRREVKVNAAKDAKQKASDLLQAVGQSVGGCLHLQEIEQPSARPLMRTNMLSKSVSFSAEAAPEPELEFEKIKIEYAVLAKFAIK